MLTTRSPGDSSANSVELIAAMPVAKPAAESVPSIVAIFCSSTASVGLLLRE